MGTSTEQTTSQMLPAGAYWVGDPCYAFEDHAVWMALLESADYTGPQRILEAAVRVGELGEVDEGGVGTEQFVASGTAFGDGVFTDGDGNEYGVDAGLLGVVPVRAGEECPKGMTEMEFTEPFTVSYEDEGGVVNIGPVAIETDPKFYCDNYWCQTEVEQWEDYCDSCAEAEEDEDDE